MTTAQGYGPTKRNYKRLILGGVVTVTGVALAVIIAGEKMHELRTEIHIDAPPEAVWQALTDVERFGEWNPFIHRIEGELKKGAQLKIEIGSPEKPMRFQPTVLRAEPNRELRWLGSSLVRGIFDGEHVFELVPTENGTRFVHWERFSGILVPFAKGWLEKNTRPGFESMNVALKKRAESAVIASR